MYRSVLALLFASVLLLGGCAAQQQTVPKEKSGRETNMDRAAFDRSDEEITYMDTKDNVIYLAGGCFWGMEQLMQSIPGVIDAESGYANGTCEADADYKTVCKGETGFRETVRVEYDPEQVSLDALLLAYFYVIDPAVQNRQGNDRGSQYQTGVYFTNESARETVKRIAEIERGRSEKFFVEIGPLKNFYPAEEYHQNYLEKNPNGYCHIPRAEMELFSRLRIDPGDYQKPAAESIRDKLTAEQYVECDRPHQNSRRERSGARKADGTLPYLWRVPAGFGPFDADPWHDAAKNHRCDHCGRSRDYCRPAGVCPCSRKNTAAHTGVLQKGGTESAGAAAHR